MWYSCITRLPVAFQRQQILCNLSQTSFPSLIKYKHKKIHIYTIYKHPDILRRSRAGPGVFVGLRTQSCDHPSSLNSSQTRTCRIVHCVPRMSSTWSSPRSIQLLLLLFTFLSVTSLVAASSKCYPLFSDASMRQVGDQMATIFASIFM